MITPRAQYQNSSYKVLKRWDSCMIGIQNRNRVGLIWHLGFSDSKFLDDDQSEDAAQPNLCVPVSIRLQQNTAVMVLVILQLTASVLKRRYPRSVSERNHIFARDGKRTNPKKKGLRGIFQLRTGDAATITSATALTSLHKSSNKSTSLHRVWSLLMPNPIRRARASRGIGGRFPWSILTLSCNGNVTANMASRFDRPPFICLPGSMTPWLELDIFLLIISRPV